MSESVSCIDSDGTEDKSVISIHHYCNNCENEIWEWSSEISPSKAQLEAQLLAQLRERVEGLTRYKAHAYRNSPDLYGSYLDRSEVLSLLDELEK